MESRISFQQSVTKGQPKPLTIDSPEVKSICDQIAALDPSTPDYNDRKQALKRRLPIIIPHAASFRNGKRISADAIPSGLAMLDVDHVDNPKEWFDSIAKQLLSDNRIYLVSITASGKGLRIIGERLSLSGAPGVSAEKTSSIGSDSIRQLESIEAAQLRMATALNITEYDAVTKDLARAWSVFFVHCVRIESGQRLTRAASIRWFNSRGYSREREISASRSPATRCSFVC